MKRLYRMFIVLPFCFTKLINFKNILFIIIFFYVYEYIACVYVKRTHVTQCPGRSEEGVRSGTGVTAMWVLESNPGPLQGEREAATEAEVTESPNSGAGPVTPEHMGPPVLRDTAGKTVLGSRVSSATHLAALAHKTFYISSSKALHCPLPFLPSSLCVWWGCWESWGAEPGV